MVQKISTNTFGVAKWIVSANAAQGTHTTIPAALASASSGDTILIRDGTYTGDFSHKAGVVLTALPGDGYTPNVIIHGKITCTGAGTFTISSIQLKTNSDNYLVVSGSSETIVNLINCNLNAVDNTGISYTCSNASSVINISGCSGDLGTTGIAIYNMTSTGTIGVQRSDFSNSGLSTIASNNSAGNVSFLNSQVTGALSTSSTGNVQGYNTTLANATNTTCITTSGTGVISGWNQGLIASGSASCISIGAGTTFSITGCTLSSVNTHAVTGAGVLVYAGINFAGGSSAMNVTTQTGGTLQGSTFQNPTSGFLGEQISNTASNVATTSTVTKTITSINLTPGIWDITGIAASSATGGSLTIVYQLVGISLTDNVISGVTGIDLSQINSTSQVLSGVIPVVRAVVTTTSTYYLVVQNGFTSTTCPTNGRISATRVG